ncbi:MULTISPECIES: isopenicillin N synthase family dioxygenase [unclassified Blastococcus]
MAAVAAPVVVDGFVPVVDLSAAAGGPRERAALAAGIDQACRRSGFFVVTGHGVPADLVDRMHAVTRKFFALPAAEKDRAASPHPGRGFRRAPAYVAASRGLQTPPDLCETFCASRLGEPGAADPGRDDLADWTAPNTWPERPADLREVWLAYDAAVDGLAAELMRLFALGLGLPEDFFADVADHAISRLLANHYPARATPPLPGQLRKGEHTDWGSLTVLYQDGVGGLQVHQDGAGWRDVPAIAGTFVVNIGDLMQTWTGGRWASTVHRVVDPPDGPGEARISIPFFQQPPPGYVISPLPFVPPEAGFAPITSGEYMAAKSRATWTGLG